MRILYGGSFNPPTKAHLQVMQFILDNFENCELIIIPANNHYKCQEMMSFQDRLNMIKLTCTKLKGNFTISEYENSLDKYYGTYYTLEHFNHPYFVIGDDQLVNIDKWINFPKVLEDNNFIIIPRNNENILEYIKENEVLSLYQNHFIVMDNFKPIPSISSTNFRKSKDKKYVTKEVYEYIIKNKLYEVENV